MVNNSDNNGHQVLFLSVLEMFQSYSSYWCWFLTYVLFHVVSNLFKKNFSLEFPGGPVVRIWHLHCGGLGSIPGWGTKIPQATQRGQKKKKIHEQLRNLVKCFRGICQDTPKVNHT